MLDLAVGDLVKTELFEVGETVDVTGTSKGKGFAGSIKRHNQHRGPMTHGSRYHRSPGSMGPIKGNMKGKNLPGQMGHEKVTIQNLKVVGVDVENQLLLISGSVPGPKKKDLSSLDLLLRVVNKEGYHAKVDILNQTGKKSC